MTGFGVVEEATSVNAVTVLCNAIKRFDIHTQIKSDHGSQFTGSNKKKKCGKSKLTEFQKELLDLGFIHLKARVKHPQTNGKIERFVGSVKSEM